MFFDYEIGNSAGSRLAGPRGHPAAATWSKARLRGLAPQPAQAGFAIRCRGFSRRGNTTQRR
jgi:hypothetical protein